MRLVVGLLVAGALAAACTGGEPPAPHRTALRALHPEGPVGAAIPNVPVRRPYLLALGFPLCTTGAPVSVRAVTPARGSGPIHVLNWAVRERTAAHRYPAEPGAEPGNIFDVPGYRKAPIRTPCMAASQTSAPYTTMDLSLELTRPGTGYAFAWVIHYRGAGRAGTAVVPFRTRLCSGPHCPDVELFPS